MIGSKISPNGFNLTTIDGYTGKTISKKINEQNGKSQYLCTTNFDGINAVCCSRKAKSAGINPGCSSCKGV